MSSHPALPDESAIRENEARLQSVSDNLPGGLVYQIDSGLDGRDRRFSYISAGVERLHGVSVAEALADASIIYNQLPSEDRLLVAEREAQALAAMAPFQAEVRFRHPSGEIRWVFYSSAPRRLSNGHVVWDGVEIDITARRRMEIELAEKTRFLNDLIQNSGAVIFIKDREGRYKLVNRKWTEITGCPAEMVLGHTDEVLFPGPSSRQFRRDDLEVMASRRAMEKEEFLDTTTGKRFFLTIKFPLMDDNGQVTGLCGMATEITDRRRAETALAESERRFRDLFDNSRDGFVVVDGCGRFLDANSAYCRMLGYTLEELRRKSDFYDITPARWREWERREIWEKRLLREGYSGIYEKEYIRKDGVVFPVELQSYAIFDAQGNPLYLWGIARDITERHQAEAERERLQAQLIQAQKMESVGRLAGGVAHDFNNMLGIILGRTELAMSRMAPGDPMSVNLQEIRKAAERSADLTRQLLAFARKQNISPRSLDLNQAVEGMLSMLRRLIGENIELVWKPHQGLWPVKMDPSQFDQLLANLCINARDAISGLGVIVLETRNLTLDNGFQASHGDIPPGDHVCITVSDDGCGMDRATLEKIFDPFFTTKEMGKGTGLGLATVHGIVSQNGGGVHVESRLGRGASFTVFLPRSASSDAKRREPSINEAGEPLKGHETILLVEDEPALLNVGKIMLESLGYQVLEAATPADAIAIAEERAGGIHLLMTDVIMPEMNGRELARRLACNHPAIRCLFMSGYTADLIGHHGVLDKGVQFIQKPFTLGELAVKIRDVLRGPQ